ncbi:hypothetical protein MANY_44950 [Mycolicibacterium anyangense]|uniref:Uncharacterized protein n=1 Tax=Mycolicibacterium anyangense TaxID=1431246 RepID=A0A6N4WF52_9MYCO|nr:hypothetical protein MANY_44950 [Mycolicibacterium anyangense]
MPTNTMSSADFNDDPCDAPATIHPTKATNTAAAAVATWEVFNTSPPLPTRARKFASKEILDPRGAGCGL